MELHHDPFLSFALSGYNHEWYGTVHAHHASLSFPICMENIFGWHSIHHPFPTRRRRYHYMRNIFTFASMLSRIIHGCIQETLPYRISVYRKQAGNSETMTSTRKTRNGNHQVWYMEAIQASLSHANSQLQRRIEQDEHDPVQFCSSTYVDIADNNRKSQANPLPAFHMLSLVAWRTRDFRRLLWHLTGMTGSSQHDHKQVRDNLAIRQRGIGKYSGSRTVSIIKDSFRIIKDSFRVSWHEHMR